jgi:hypothetical protein
MRVSAGMLLLLACSMPAGSAAETPTLDFTTTLLTTVTTTTTTFV